MTNLGRHHITINQETGWPADTGCEVSPLCVECPLPQCRYDDPIWYIAWRRRQRAHRVKARMQDLETAHMKVRAVEIASEEFGFDVRTVYRLLRLEETP